MRPLSSTVPIPVLSRAPRRQLGLLCTHGQLGLLYSTLANFPTNKQWVKCRKIQPILIHHTPWRNFCIPRPEATKSHLVINEISANKTPLGLSSFCLRPISNADAKGHGTGTVTLSHCHTNKNKNPKNTKIACDK
jgi:hypothetical protein